jgi:glycosyltransferase involved in cell wall biosynthesis
MTSDFILNKTKISVVIPSLGGDCLKATIENLNNNSSIIPDEIIVVIPDEHKVNIPDIISSNLQFELVSFKGQVAQRIYGFKMAKNEFVLQLDDDIQLDYKCIQILVSALMVLGNGCAVGPSIFYSNTKNSAFSLGKGISKAFFDLKSYLLSGSFWGKKRMGSISRNGVGFGFDSHYLIHDINKSEWLAGGCVLHFQSGLIFNDYFPLQGKAYGEDLIHSLLLVNSGIKLYNVKSAVCYIEKPVLNSNNYSLFSDYQSRLYLNELRGKSKFRIHFWFISRCIYNFIKSLTS